MFLWEVISSFVIPHSETGQVTSEQLLELLIMAFVKLILPLALVASVSCCGPEYQPDGIWCYRATDAADQVRGFS